MIEIRLSKDVDGVGAIYFANQLPLVSECEKIEREFGGRLAHPKMLDLPGGGQAIRFELKNSAGVDILSDGSEFAQHITEDEWVALQGGLIRIKAKITDPMAGGTMQLAAEAFSLPRPDLEPEFYRYCQDPITGVRKLAVIWGVFSNKLGKPLPLVSTCIPLDPGKDESRVLPPVVPIDIPGPTPPLLDPPPPQKAKVPLLLGLLALLGILGLIAFLLFLLIDARDSKRRVVQEYSEFQQVASAQAGVMSNQLLNAQASTEALVSHMDSKIKGLETLIQDLESRLKNAEDEVDRLRNTDDKDVTSDGRHGVVTVPPVVGPDITIVVPPSTSHLKSVMVLEENPDASGETGEPMDLIGDPGLSRIAVPPPITPSGDSRRPDQQTLPVSRTMPDAAVVDPVAEDMLAGENTENQGNSGGELSDDWQVPPPPIQNNDGPFVPPGFAVLHHRWEPLNEDPLLPAFGSSPTPPDLLSPLFTNDYIVKQFRHIVKDENGNELINQEVEWVYERQ